MHLDLCFLRFFRCFVSYHLRASGNVVIAAFGYRTAFGYRSCVLRTSYRVYANQTIYIYTLDRYTHSCYMLRTFNVLAHLYWCAVYVDFISKNCSLRYAVLLLLCMLGNRSVHAVVVVVVVCVEPIRFEGEVWFYRSCVHYALIPNDLIANYCVYSLCLFFGTD